MSSMYVGRDCDPDSREPTGPWATLDPDDLTRHAVVLGATGSGKTGLVVVMLEELAMARVPILAVDPKGDLANLALSFPDLDPSDFARWVDPSEAERQGITAEDLAARTAEAYRKGHTAWRVDAERRRVFHERADVLVLTPGSTSGIPVDVLAGITTPPPGLEDDEEGRVAYAIGAAGALLGLVGEAADPLRDPPAILLVKLLGDAWAEGRPMPLDALLPAIVDPPFSRLGVFPLDDLYPRKERLDLAMRLNAVVASPAFGAWREGAPLDVDALLSPRDGRTPVRVLQLAHLDDGQRTFFLTLLLHQVVAWTRRQAGTGALRALLCLDEVAGLMPPHPRNPPTKGPLLTLLKQARAQGVGVLLGTQNPVDLDYKALSNAGSWFVGRLRAAQDREKVAEGLAGMGDGLARADVDTLLADLPGRTFVYRGPRDPGARLVHARWAMSYLRGPLTRHEVAAIDQRWDGPTASRPTSPSSSAPATPARSAPPALPVDVPTRWLTQAHALSPELVEPMAELLESPREDGLTRHVPAVLARFSLVFDERGYRHEATTARLFLPADGEPLPLDLPDEALREAPPERAGHAPLPEALDQAAEWKRFEKDVVDDVFRGETHVRFRCPALKLDGEPGLTREAFEVLVNAAAREQADEALRELADKRGRAIEALRRKRDDAADDVAKHETTASALKTEEMVGAGETLLSFFVGRRRSVTTAVSRRRRVLEAQERVRRAEQDVADLDLRILDAEQEAAEEAERLEAEVLEKASRIEAQEIGLERSDVRLEALWLVWVPVTRPV